MSKDEVSVRTEDRRFGYMVLWFFTLLCGLNFLGIQLLGLGVQGWFIVWQKLPSPPTAIKELAAPWAYVRIVGKDNIVYGKAVYDEDGLAEPWFVEEQPVPEEADRVAPHCTLEDLPPSLSFEKPSSLQECRKFPVHIEARYSYVVLDSEQQLWVWVDSWSWGDGLFWILTLFVTSVIVAPLLSILIVKRFYR
jgi:hypothetical protein